MSHHRISSTDSEVRITLNVSIAVSGSQSVKQHNGSPRKGILSLRSKTNEFCCCCCCCCCCSCVVLFCFVLFFCFLFSAFAFAFVSYTCTMENEFL